MKNNYTRKNKTKKTKTVKRKEIFTEDDYNSHNGMSTSIWGPCMWFFLHTMSFNYPVEPSDEDKHHYREFILSLQHVLPCKYCRLNLTKNFKTLPLTMEDMKNRHRFSLYIYNLHELINKMLLKKSNLTYEDVRERFEHFRGMGPTKVDDIKKEMGCSEPLYGKKSKTIIKIIPQEVRCNTIQIDKKCIKKRKHIHTENVENIK